MYRPELDDEQKQLIYAAFAASLYPKGLDYGTVESDGSPPIDDVESDGAQGLRWIEPEAAPKKRPRKSVSKKIPNEDIASVKVQDFFTRTTAASSVVRPWDVVLIEDVAPGYPSLAVVKKLWRTPAGKVEAEVSWMYRCSDLPLEVQQTTHCKYPPVPGKRCAVKLAESEEFHPEVGCMRELLFSDHTDVIEPKEIVHTARAFFLGRDEEEPVQHFSIADIDVAVAIPGHVCRRMFRSREQRVLWLDDSALPMFLKKEVAKLMSRTKEDLQNEAVGRPYSADVAQLAPEPEFDAAS